MVRTSSSTAGPTPRALVDFSQVGVRPGANRESPDLPKALWRSGSKHPCCTASCIIEEDRKRGAGQVPQTAAGHRRSADGRHEVAATYSGAGKMFPAAGREERSRDETRGRHLQPFMEARRSDGRQARARQLVLATVKGDVH